MKVGDLVYNVQNARSGIIIAVACCTEIIEEERVYDVLWNDGDFRYASRTNLIPIAEVRNG